MWTLFKLHYFESASLQHKQVKNGHLETDTDVVFRSFIVASFYRFSLDSRKKFQKQQQQQQSIYKQAHQCEHVKTTREFTQM